MIYNIIAKILVLKVKKTDYGVMVRFPMWMSHKMKEKILINIREDCEVNYHKPCKFELGYRTAKIEYTK